MMPHIDPCLCPIHRPHPYRPLTRLLLQCWQRQHDQRPYNTLLLNRILFAARFHRAPDASDYAAIIAFLADPSELAIDNLELNYLPLPELAVCEPFLRLAARLTHLSLCHVDMGADHLATLLRQPFSLQSLRLSGNQFSAEHAATLGTFLLTNRTLAYLDLGYCSLDHSMLANIADGLLQCRSLRALDLSRLVQMHAAHKTDASKIALLIAQLMWPNRLHELHLKHCDLDGHDVVPIVEYVRWGEQLVYLDVGSNRLGAPGVAVLLAACREAPHLIGLDISNNGLGEEGGREIAQQLAFTGIRYLDIGRNSIPATAMRDILCSLKKSVPLRLFNIIGNGFDYRVGKALRRLLDARILLFDAVDVRCTYDAAEQGFRVVPVDSERTRYNYRYLRVQPFIRAYDAVPNLLWHSANRRRLLVNGLYLDAIFVDAQGAVFSLDARGKRTPVASTRIYNF